MSRSVTSQYWHGMNSESGPKDTPTTHMDSPNSREKFGLMWDQKHSDNDRFLYSCPMSWRYGTKRVGGSWETSHECICVLVSEWKWRIKCHYHVTSLSSNFISLKYTLHSWVRHLSVLYLLQDKPGCKERKCSEGWKRDPIQCIPFTITATVQPSR